MNFKEARAKIKNAFGTISTTRRQIDTLEEVIEANHDTIVDLVKPFIPPYEEGQEPDDEPEYVVPHIHDCPDERNPAGTCVYDDMNDGCHDFCLFCGAPEERK